jgi:hypothetical protein
LTVEEEKKKLGKEKKEEAKKQNREKVWIIESCGGKEKEVMKQERERERGKERRSEKERKSMSERELKRREKPLCLRRDHWGQDTTPSLQHQFLLLILSFETAFSQGGLSLQWVMGKDSFEASLRNMVEHVLLEE